ncbi:unnamed protein product [Linum trigynum]|uniref:Thaumatin-like protein n=1 Tax=Linum trigynum TaxID=586398 RepID=A0AAV2CME4_9ROSI
MAAPLIPQFLLLFILGTANFFPIRVVSTTITITNQCDYTVWPGILSNADVAPLPTTGFALQKGETRTISPPASWGGRLWGRTHCSEDSTGKFSCTTGDCGSGQVECSGTGATPRHARRIQARRLRRPGLLRRQPRRRLQPPRPCLAVGRVGPELVCGRRWEEGGERQRRWFWGKKEVGGRRVG